MRLLRLSSGLEETHGEPTGERKDSSESKCTLTTFPLRETALLVSQPSPRHPQSSKLSSDYTVFFENLDTIILNNLTILFQYLFLMSVFAISVYSNCSPMIMESTDLFRFNQVVDLLEAAF